MRRSLRESRTEPDPNGSDSVRKPCRRLAVRGVAFSGRDFASSVALWTAKVCEHRLRPLWLRAAVTTSRAQSSFGWRRLERPQLLRRRRGSSLLGLPEDLGDLVDLGEQLVGHVAVEGALGAGGAGELGGLVDQGVQLGVLLEVRGLEVVGPQHPEVVLDQ